MNKYLTLTILKVCLGLALAQNPALYQGDGALITIGKQSTLYIGGDYETKSRMFNDNLVTIAGDLYNYSQQKVFGAIGTVQLSGSLPQQVFGPQKFSFNHLVIDKAANNVTLRQTIYIDSTLNLKLGSVDIDSSSVLFKDYVGRLLHETQQNRVFSNSTGKLIALQMLDPSTSYTNIAGLGLYIDAPTHTFGATRVERAHLSQADAGTGSIMRTYRFLPSIPATNPSEVKAVKLSFHKNEVPTFFPDPTALELFQKDATKGTWLAKGGQPDLFNYSLNSTQVYTIPASDNMFSMAIQNKQSSCDTKNPNHVNVRYLVASQAFEGDTVYFINLSSSAKKISRYDWAFGDGYNAEHEDVSHIYKLQGDYVNSLSATNTICSNFTGKSIKILPNVLKKDLEQDPSQIFLIPIGYYPNPTKDFVFFSTELNQNLQASLSLFDPLGRQIFAKSITQASIKEVINFSHLASGIYLLKFTVLDKNYTYKIIRE